MPAAGEPLLSELQLRGPGELSRVLCKLDEVIKFVGGQRLSQWRHRVLSAWGKSFGDRQLQKKRDGWCFRCWPDSAIREADSILDSDVNSGYVCQYSNEVWQRSIFTAVHKIWSTTNLENIGVAKENRALRVHKLKSFVLLYHLHCHWLY